MTIEMLEGISEFPERAVPMLNTLVTLVGNGTVTVRRYAERPWFVAVFAAQAERVRSSI